MAGMSAVIGDDLLSHFVVEGSWDGISARVVERCLPLAGHDVHVVLYLAGMAGRDPSDTFERFGGVARQIVATSSV